jgi:hypothetical protein
MNERVNTPVPGPGSIAGTDIAAIASANPPVKRDKRACSKLCRRRTRNERKMRWRQSHPNGPTENQLQALSSEAATYRLSPSPVIDKARSSFAQTHPHGLSERELQALSSEGPAWQLPSQSATRALASTNEAGFALAAAK